MTTRPKTDKPRKKRERELHAKEQLGNLINADTRNALEKLKADLEGGTK